MSRQRPYKADQSAPEQPRFETLAERVTYLVDLYHGGSVNAAAWYLGIPQRTLARVASGETQRPGIDVLQTLALGFDVTVGWLLLGEGKGPELTPPPGPVSKPQSAWYELVLSLGLPPLSQSVMLDVPLRAFALAQAVDHLGAEGDRARVMERTARFVADISSAWTDYLRDAIADRGIESVRDSLSSEWAMAMVDMGGGTIAFQSVLPDLQRRQDAIRLLSRSYARRASSGAGTAGGLDEETVAGRRLSAARRKRKNGESDSGPYGF